MHKLLPCFPSSPRVAPYERVVPTVELPILICISSPICFYTYSCTRLCSDLVGQRLCRVWRSNSYLGVKCCIEGQYNEVCGGPPKFCEADTDFAADDIVNYDCKATMSEADCTQKGGDKYRDGKCRMEINSGGFTDADRKSRCAKIGGTITLNTCKDVLK